MDVTILCDSREQKPYTFDAYDVDAETATLATGDYTIAAFCTVDDNDTYHPEYAIERKSANDFLTSITSQRDRFRRELERAGEWPEPIEVVVEEPWTTFTHNLNLMQYRSIDPAHVEGTVREWTDAYNVSFRFMSDRHCAERHTYDRLVARYRAGQY